jgi:teichuronic acid biosynthesis glycosyltransferase TuaG
VNSNNPQRDVDADQGRVLVKVSVIVPTYNSAATIRATLDSILRQTHPAAEILVMDDGSTDDTVAILNSYASQIISFRQANSGPSAARSALIEKANGELIAFIDSDDVWHPRYLETQKKLYESHPTAAALFTGHQVFYGPGDIQWDGDLFAVPQITELITALNFLKMYNETPGYFYPSFCCVPSRILRAMGKEPFQGRVAEDCYFYNRLVLHGPVARTTTPLAGYRIRGGSLSSDLVKLTAGAVQSFELLEEQFQKSPDAEYRLAFCLAYAVRRRDFAKALFGANKISEGRQQLRRSMASSHAPISLAKSLWLLLLSYLPRGWQPTWPVSARN